MSEVNKKLKLKIEWRLFFVLLMFSTPFVEMCGHGSDWLDSPGFFPFLILATILISWFNEKIPYVFTKEEYNKC